MLYLLLKILHILMAIAFVGSLFFQVLILSPAVQVLEQPQRQHFMLILGQQARKVIHWVVLFLYASGVGLVWPYRHLLLNPLASTFSLLLTIKLCLALLIVLHYAGLILLRRRQLLTERGMFRLNCSLMLHGVALVSCAKAMFLL